MRRLQDTLGSINSEIHQKNETISRIESEMVRRNAVIEKKQGTVDQYNKKIDLILTKEGVSFCFSSACLILLELSIQYCHTYNSL